MLTSIGPLDDVEKALLALGTRHTLRTARSIYPYRFGWPIYRWERRADELSNRSIEENKLEWQWPRDNYDFHKYLTFADIRFLADFESLDAPDVEQVFTEQTRLALPTAGTPVSLSNATTLLEFSLLLCVLYFWLFQREARLASTGPKSGTLFSAFGRTRLSRVLFLLLVSIPAWSAALLAYRSMEFGKPLNIAIAASIVAGTAVIANQASRVYVFQGVRT